MGKYSRSLCVTLAACALGAGAVPAVAQTEGSDRAVPAAVASKQKAEIAKGDPQRWYKAPRSDQARLQIQRKEITAAYNEAKNACRKEPAANRSQCLKEARIAYQDDMRNAKGLVAMSPTSSVTESTGPVDTSGAASTAVGSSGAGATGSGGGSATGTTESASGSSTTGSGATGTGTTGSGTSGTGAAGSTGSGTTGSGTSRNNAAGTEQVDGFTGQSATSGSAASGAMIPPPEKPRTDKR